MAGVSFLVGSDPLCLHQLLQWNQKQYTALAPVNRQQCTLRSFSLPPCLSVFFRGRGTVTMETCTLISTLISKKKDVLHA
jgi:hypothetical protein